MAVTDRTSLLSRLKWSGYLAGQMLGQQRLPFRPAAELERIQVRRLRVMLPHAYRTVPYYRETMDRLGLRPEDFRVVGDLARLPVIEPGDLQTDSERFLSTGRPRDQYILLRTGGSTGDPRPIYHSAEAIFQNAAHGERERSIIWALLGKRFGYRETVIASLNCTAAKLQDFVQSRGFMPDGLKIRRQYLSLMDPPQKNVPLINGFKPDIIYTYGSYLEILFSYLADSGEEFHRPRAVTYSSDGLSESARRLIQESFDIPVFSTYQANEALKIGFECDRHTGLHLNADLYPVRIVDASGNDVPAGQTGDLVVSNLVNNATVLLNYRLGDLAAMLGKSCPCGRTLPLLSFPPGRCDDLITLPSGRIIHPQAVRTVLTVEDRVRQYQIVQRSVTHFDVKIVAARDTDRPALRERVAREFALRFGAEVRTDIAFVDAIDRTPAGKFRPVISLHARSTGSAEAVKPPRPESARVGEGGPIPPGEQDQGRRRAAAARSPNPESPGGHTATEPGGPYWDSIARDWQRHAPHRLWRTYCDALHTALLDRWLDGRRFQAALKTDLFDEAVADGLYPALASRAAEVTGLDVSPEIVAAASRKYPALRVREADVRRLPFADLSFDLILSGSTLDHFDSRADILTALGELSRTLSPGGRLVLTMDNPANPAVWVRNHVPLRMLKHLGLVPYFVGVTGGRRWLERSLRQAGLAVVRSTAIMHCPRVIAVAAADRLGRSADRRRQEAFTQRLMAWERMERFPTRYRTGHFVAVLAAKPASEPAGE